MTVAQQPKDIAHDSGFALVTMLIIMLPLLAMVMSMSSLISGRDAGLISEMDEYRALHAAESGLDECVYRFRNGTLTFGSVSSFDMGDGTAFTIGATWLDTDGEDNDNDSTIDESDEHVVELISRGTYRNHVKRLALYLTGTQPSDARAAFTTRNPNILVNLVGTTTLSGNDTNMDGSTPSPAFDGTGIAISPPGTIAHLNAELDPTEELRVIGLGGTPSLALSNDILNVAQIIEHYRTAADEVLLSSSYDGYVYGDGLLGIAQSTFREGDVTFENGSIGAGVLVVTGDVSFLSSARFDGLVVVGGSLRMAASATIYGAVLQSSAGTEVSDTGGSSVLLSSQALNLANTVWTVPDVATGWQQIGND